MYPLTKILRLASFTDIDKYISATLNTYLSSNRGILSFHYLKLLPLFKYAEKYFNIGDSSITNKLIAVIKTTNISNIGNYREQIL